MFALIGQLTGNSRLGILSLIFFFIIGILLLKFVDIDKGIEEAKRASNKNEEVKIRPQ